MGDDSDGVIILGIGVLIGALFAYLIMKTRVQQPPATPAMHVMYIPYFPPVPAAPPPPAVQTAAVLPAPEKAVAVVQAQAPVAEPVPPAIPVAKDEKRLEISKDNKGKLSLITSDRKVLARA